MESNKEEYASKELWEAFVRKSMNVSIWRLITIFLTIISLLSYWWVPMKLANKIVISMVGISILTQIFSHFIMQSLSRLFYIGNAVPLKKNIKP
jgi:hypothetical protein